MNLSDRMIEFTTEIFNWMVYTYIPITAIKSEEIAMNAQEDLAKSSTSHDVVDDEVEAYAKLRKLVRLDHFSEPEHFTHALQAMQHDNAIGVREAKWPCSLRNLLSRRWRQGPRLV